MKKEDETFNSIKHHVSAKISVDCVIFDYDDKELRILLIKEEDAYKNISWSLPKKWIEKENTIESTAIKVVKEYTGADYFFMEQLKAFDHASQSSSSEDISIGYYALVKNEKINCVNRNDDFVWCNSNAVPYLNYNQNIIFDFSLKQLRNHICYTAIGFNLLPQKFTLLQVIHLYEAILGIEVDKSNFRRKILQLGLIMDLNEKEKNVSHRAAKLYKFKEESHINGMAIGLNFKF